MTQQDIQHLLDKYNSGTASPEEVLSLELWYHQEASTSEWTIPEDKKEILILKLKKEVYQQIGRPVRKINWYKYAAAAAVLVLLSFGLYFVIQQRGTSADPVNVFHKNDINPGGNKAVLTLADGRKVILDETRSGLVTSQGKAIIRKTADGTLIYNGDEHSGVPVTNKLSIPRGGQYKITLTDGTRVWLNSATTLTYPTAFSGKERNVELSGEAYFEVAKDKTHPFIVRTGKQEVEVLGTHFNINGYTDETATKTTLLEGSVRVSSNGMTRILKPGQQAALSEDNLEVREVEAQYAIAWKDGYFMFDNENLESVMAKISRWYNVEIQYDDPSIRKETVFGTISKFENASKVLKRLESAGVVKFEISNNIIHVKRN